MIPLDKIENTETCFLQLWLLLENTRLQLRQQYKRYTIRNILQSWFGSVATDDFIWEVCTKAEQLGLNELPLPDVNPIVATLLTQHHIFYDRAIIDFLKILKSYFWMTHKQRPRNREAFI